MTGLRHQRKFAESLDGRALVTAAQDEVMPHSLPSLEEIRRVFGLLGECCELGADPIVWRQHLAEGCTALVKDHFVNVVESKVESGPNGMPTPTTLAYFNGGPLPHQRFEIISRFMEAPAEISPVVPALLSLQRPSVTHRRCELVPDRAWHRSEFFQSYLRPLGLYDQVTSVELAAPHAVSAICWLNCERRRCTTRASRMLDLLHKELARLKRLGRLAPLGGFSLTDLSPRQREVLYGLLQGDSEKQLALRLKISRHTTHDYLKALHRRFGVNSRSELLSRCLKFWPALDQMQNKAR